IRDRNVTGVQTCALPIYFFTSREDVATLRARQQKGVRHFTGQNSVLALISKLSKYHNISYVQLESSQQKVFLANTKKAGLVDQKIGRASCRERVKMHVAA